MAKVASTSRAAFHSITGPTAESLRSVILEIIEEAGVRGCIMDEVFDKFPESYRPGGTISSRFSELEEAGHIFRNGDTRPGDSGRQQKVMRHVNYLDEVPAAKLPKARANPFLAGMVHAAKLVVAAEDLARAKSALGAEIRKVAKR